MWSRYAFFAAISFVVHFAWEATHIHLYTAYEALGSGLPLLVWATTGDVLYVLSGAVVVSLVSRDMHWLAHPRASHYVFAAGYGFLAAIAIEWKALILHKWAYTTAMPILPIVHVGLSPVAQMTLLVPLAVYATQYLYHRFTNI